MTRSFGTTPTSAELTMLQTLRVASVNVSGCFCSPVFSTCEDCVVSRIDIYQAFLSTVINIVDLLSNRWDFSTDVSVYDEPLVYKNNLDNV